MGVNKSPPVRLSGNYCPGHPLKRPQSEAVCSDVSSLLRRYSSSLLEPIRETEIRSEGAGVVGHGVEKSAGLKAEKVERDDGVGRGGPANLEVSLRAEIAGMAGGGWIDQGSASNSIYPVVR